MRPNCFFIIIKAKMDNGCNYEVAGSGIIKEINAPIIPETGIEIEMMRFIIEETMGLQRPFGGTPISKELVNQREISQIWGIKGLQWRGIQGETKQSWDERERTWTWNPLRLRKRRGQQCKFWIKRKESRRSHTESHKETAFWVGSRILNSQKGGVAQNKGWGQSQILLHG